LGGGLPWGAGLGTQDLDGGLSFKQDRHSPVASRFKASRLVVVE
jgi:hypothetical protein